MRTGNTVRYPLQVSSCDGALPDTSILLFIEIYILFGRILAKLLSPLCSLFFMIHETAAVHESATIGAGTKVWDYVKIREGATIGVNCTIGRLCYVDYGVSIGSGVKLQNGIDVWHGVTLEDQVFVGPGVLFTNDRFPRAALWDDSRLGFTRIEKGASLGAGAIIVCGTKDAPRVVGSYAMVAAGSLVTRDVAPYHLVLGSPARPVAYVSSCGHPAQKRGDTVLYCRSCDAEVDVGEPLKAISD